MFLIGVAVHHERNRRAVGHLHQHRLLVDHVIVAAIDTAAIGASLDGLTAPSIRDVSRNYVEVGLT